MLKLFATNDDWVGLIARLTVGIVLFPHGAQKLLGWWEGHGYTATMEFLTKNVKLPYIIGVLVILIEFVCPLLMALGIATRIAASLILIVMIGIITTVQNKYFFMNWFGTQDGEGMEFFLLMIGLCLVSIFAGGGKFSIDRFIQTQLP